MLSAGSGGGSLSAGLNAQKKKHVAAAAGAVGGIVGSVASPAAPAAAAVGAIAGPPAAAPVGPNLVRIASTYPAAVQPFIAPAMLYGARYGIPPSVLLGLIDTESSFNGNAVGPPVASRGGQSARGSTQFLAEEAQKYGVQPGNSPDQIASQVRGAAHYLADLGFHNDPSGALDSYSGGAYSGVNAKPFTHLDAVASRIPSSQLPKPPPYAYPFGPNISIGRTDEGIDPYGPGPISTIGKAKYLGEGGAGWPTEGGSGTGPVYKLLKGPLAGENVYTYEGITPNASLSPGDILKRGQVIAQSTGSSFETGFAQGRAAGFQPTAAPHYSEGDVTPEGTAFKQLISQLGQGGTVSGGVPFTSAPASYGAPAASPGLGGVVPQGASGGAPPPRSGGVTPLSLPFAASAPMPTGPSPGLHLTALLAAAQLARSPKWRLLPQQPEAPSGF